MPPSLALLPLLGPVALLAVYFLARRQPGLRPRDVLAASRWASCLVLLIALIAVLATAVQGPATSALIGWNGLGLSVRLDAISGSLFVLVAFIGVIVLQYSRNYLDGDPRQGRFLGGMCLTLAAVIVLVLAGNLFQLVGGWIATSLSLHRLLVFYRERPAAQVAARKKFIIARISDASLIVAAISLASAFGSSDIATILQRASVSVTTPFPIALAALLLALSAMLKSAQFPTHGWLPEVMETPTPVSALLHAGIINAGGFLIIRFADVMLLFAPSLHVLAIVGGFTALFGAVVMLTQTSVKVSLAWSTIAQMGFMLMECGFGAFSIALVHLIAHSLYKAHAFLASGSVVEISKTEWQPDLEQGPPVVQVLASVAMAIGIYVGVSEVFAGLGLFAHDSAAMRTLGAILIMSLSLLLAQSMRGRAPGPAIVRIALAAAGATTAYFILQTAAASVLSSTLPPIPVPSTAGLAIMLLAGLSFFGVTLLQILAPARTNRAGWRAARVHLENGLYANVIFNRLVGALRPPAQAAHYRRERS
ncbi:MAG: NADH-quinone oxidoreductase subunit L [Xanthomonadales bacterium]|nr:NADH-quinone oxidoreductase subunit L [Xanthomonadales bacterium]